MAEKQSFVQIVDTATGKVERVVDQRDLEALSVEDKLALARTKTLYVVSHKLEPVIKVEMRKVNITAPLSYQEEQQEPAMEIKPEPKAAEPKPKAEPKVAEQKIIPVLEPEPKPTGKGRTRKG